MIYFVMSAENSLEKTAKIQENNLDHTYLCNDMFPHFNRLNSHNNAKIEAMKDVVSVADGIIVIGYITDDMLEILDFAEEIKMEVEYLEDAR